MEVSVRDLKNHLSEYLRRAESGEEIVVTSHGRPVGRLVGPLPPGTPARSAGQAALARLNALAYVRPGDGKPLKVSEQPMAWQPGDATLAELVLEDRE